MFYSGNRAAGWRGWASRLGSGLALVALLAVFTASYWHGHDHEHDDADHKHQEQSCPVCVAVHTPVSDALPPSVPCVLRLERVSFVVVDDERAGAVLPLRIGLARGPPVSGAVV